MSLDQVIDRMDSLAWLKAADTVCGDLSTPEELSSVRVAKTLVFDVGKVKLVFMNRKTIARQRVP